MNRRRGREGGEKGGGRGGGGGGEVVGGERVSEGVGVLGSDAQGGRVGCCPVKLSCVCVERVVRGEREGSIGIGRGRRAPCRE